MLGRAVLLQLILWIASAHAFFPWFPTWMCAKDDELCKANAQERSEPEGVRFKLVRRARYSPHNSLKERVASTAHQLAQKRGGSNSFSVVTAATPTATNAVGIDQDGTDFSYFVEAKLGSASTLMYMLLDTGAGTTWVMGADCTSAACKLHRSFGTADSTSLDVSDNSFSIAYGSGTVSGRLATDVLAVGSVSTKLTFGLANTTSSDFTHFPFDGILGMSMSKGVTDNFLSVLSTAHLLPANLFAVSLSRASDSDGGATSGEIMFGATDSTKYTGSLAYTAVASKAGGDWAVALDDVGYNGGKAGVSGRLAYIDTGTTYMFGPTADVAALHAQIPGAVSEDGGTTYTVPCSSNQPLTVYFSGVGYSIEAADWMASTSTSSSDGNCTSNVYGHEVVKSSWLLGDLFIKNVYTVFDVDKKRIGFAKKASGSQTGTASQTGSAATMVTTATPVSSVSTTGSLPGLSGQETSATAVAQSTGTPKASATSSPADQLENRYVSMVCVVVAAIVMAV